VNLAARSILVVGLLLILSAWGGCVTERVPAKKSSPILVNRPPPTPVSTNHPGVLPSGPIATPALTARTVNARTLVSIRPIGTVPYDGMVLPIISPDGTRLATQVGDPPPWPTLLAAFGAPPTPRSRVEIYDITQSPPRIVRTKEAIPTGAILGRSSDERGFLIEAPQRDGSRRVARIAWSDGSLQWLTSGGEVNAFASLDAEGRLVCSRRGPDQAQFSLAIAGAPLDVNPGASTIFPTYDSATGLYAMFVEGSMGLEVQLRSAAGVAGAVANTDLQLISRRTIAVDAGAPTAYQAAEPMRAPVLNYSGFGEAPGVLMFHPVSRRMVVLDPDSAEFVPLAKNSIAGCWSPDAAGWAVLLTTPDGLVHQRLKRDPSNGLWEAMPVARMLGEAWVARATTSPDNPFVLIGPTKDKSRKLSVAALRFADDSEEDLEKKSR